MYTRNIQNIYKPKYEIRTARNVSYIQVVLRLTDLNASTCKLVLQLHNFMIRRKQIQFLPSSIDSHIRPKQSLHIGS